jgi:5-methylcytosine-specific restriction enzyme subunit McrC
MPKLFESFVAEWLKQNAPAEWTVTAQHTAKLKANAELTYRIDLFLKDRKSGRPIAILDTKYKATELPIESDIQQVIAYAVETGVRHAVLVYPNSRSHAVKVQSGNITVRSLPFDISSELDAAGLIFLKELGSMLPSYSAV